MSALGREIAFVVIRDHPELLDLPHGLIATRCMALANLVQGFQMDEEEDDADGDDIQKLALQPLPDGQVVAPTDPRSSMELAWQMMEQRGELLLLPSSQLEKNLHELVDALRY